MHWVSKVLYVLVGECQAGAGFTIYHARPIGQSQRDEPRVAWVQAARTQDR
jgi:hypothetical protein